MLFPRYDTVASARYCIVIWLFHADFMKKLRTALLYACWVGSITAVKMLVKRRADLNIQNSVGALTATCVVSYAVKLRPFTAVWANGSTYCRHKEEMGYSAISH
jgi:hypothetical protein